MKILIMLITVLILCVCVCPNLPEIRPHRVHWWSFSCGCHMATYGSAVRFTQYLRLLTRAASLQWRPRGAAPQRLLHGIFFLTPSVCGDNDTLVIGF